MRGEEPPSRYESRIITQSGETKWVDFAATVIRYHGAPAILTVALDVTQHKRAAQALQESEARLRWITDAVPAVIYQYERRPDGTQRFLFLNEKVQSIFGVPREEVLADMSRVWALIPTEEEAGQVAQSILAAYETYAPWSLEYRIRTPYGTVKWIRGESVPVLRREDGTVVWTGTLSDITERKRAEEQVRRQMEELQRWHNVTLGREGRVLELKGEVNRLLARLGEPPRYAQQDG